MTPQAVVAVLGIVGIVALLVGLIRYARRMAALMRKRWAEAARRLRGRFDPKSGPWYRRTPLIDARANGLPVRIDTYVVSTGKSAQTWTRAHADASQAGELAFKVHPRHALSGLAEWLGFREIRTGDEAFDKAFVVRGTDAGLVRAWLTRNVRTAMLKVSGFTYELKNGKATAAVGKLVTDAEELVAVAEATTRLADSGARLAARWNKAAQATGGLLVTEPGGGRRIELDTASVPLRIDTSVVDEEAGTGTRVTGRVIDPRGERFDLAPHESSRDRQLVPVDGAALPEGSGLCLASSDPNKTAARWSGDVRRRIEALAPARIVSDGRDVAVLLPGVVTDPDQLGEAMALADELARPPARGGYR